MSVVVPGRGASTSPLTPRVSRIVSPLFFAGALVCFFFTFAGVSCNTVKAKQAVSAFAGQSGVAPFAPAAAAGLDRCIDSLRDVTIVSYSGVSLAFGGRPSVLSSVPAACSATPVGASTSNASAQASIGVQPLALVAFIAVLAGILGGLVFLLLAARDRLRIVVAMTCALVAFLLLLLEQVRVHTVILDRANVIAAGGGAPFSVADYFHVDDGAAWFVALILLAAGVLYLVASFMILPAIVEVASPPQPPPLTDPPAPPP